MGQELCEDAPAYKADAATRWEFVSDTDQAHFI